MCLLLFILPDIGFAWMNTGVTSGGVESADVGDGSVGQTTHTAAFPIAADHQAFCEFTGDPGAVNYGHVWVQNYGSDAVELTLFSSTGAVLAYGTVTPASNDAGAQSVTLNTEVVLTAVTYYCSVNSDGGGSIFHDNLGTGNTDYEAQTYVVPPTAVSIPGTNLTSDDMSIIFTNSAVSPF